MQFVEGESRVRVNIPDAAALERSVRDRLARGAGFALATLNLDHLVKLRSDVAFRRAYAAMDFVTADGNPVVWLSRVAGRPVDLLPGSDLLLPVLRIAAEGGHKVAFLGSTAEALAAAKVALERAVPGLEVVATLAPPMGFDPEGAAAEALLREVAESGARLCIVALGAPKQEKLSALGRRIAPGVGFCCFGAALDFHAGTQRRAPQLARRLKLEWLWRAAGAPRRLGPRYARCAAILPSELSRAVALRRAETADDGAAE